MRSVDEFINFPGRSGLSVPRINQVCADFFGISEPAITGRTKSRRVVWARQTCCWLARRMTDLSYPEIGRAIGGRDHTTIMHSVRQVDNRRRRDSGWVNLTDYLEQELRDGGIGNA